MFLLFLRLLVLFSALFSKLTFSFVIPNPKNLMIHLDFENDLMDKSGNKNHGKIVGLDTAAFKEGAVGQGIEINRGFSNGLKESTFLVIHNSPFTRLGEEYTFVIWAKMYSRKQQNDLNCSEDLIEDHPKACILSLGGQYGINFFMYLFDFWDHDNAFYFHESGKTGIVINEWQQMIMTNDKNGFRIYNNGNLVKNPFNYHPDFSHLNKSDIILGKLPSSDSCFSEIPLNGMIDDFRLYNTSITDEEALGLYSLSILQTGVDCLSDLKKTNLNIFPRSEFSNNAENKHIIDVLVETDCRYPFSLHLYSFSKNQREIISIQVIEDNLLSQNFSFLLNDDQISKLECEIDVEEEILFIKIVRKCSIVFELISNNYTALKYPFYFLLEKNLSQAIESKVLLVPILEVPPVKSELENFSYLRISSFCQEDCINIPLQKTHFTRNGYLYFEIWKENHPQKFFDPIKDAIPILFEATLNHSIYGRNQTFNVLKDINLISLSWFWKYSLFLENTLYNIDGNCELSLNFLFLLKNQTIGSEILQVSFNLYDDKVENTNSDALLILLIVCIILCVAVLSLIVFIIRFVILKRRLVKKYADIKNDIPTESKEKNGKINETNEIV